MNTVTLAGKQFDDLLEYSCSLPTGMTIGKQWKARRPYYHDGLGPDNWYLGEYTHETMINGERFMEIRWRRIVCPERQIYDTMARKDEGLPVHLL